MGAGIKHFDAIVIGSGMSGGWAAKELTQLGLKTLVIESGRDVKHLKDYPTMNTMPWQFEHRGTLPFDVKNQYKSFKNHYILTEEHVHFLKKDEEQEYIEDKPFDWLRGNQVGGRSLLWGRQTQRWSDFDFTGPARDGFAVDWPIRYKDIDSWYSYVEKFVGIAGNKDNLAVLPDGEFLPPIEITCLEKHFKEKMNANYTDRHVISARVANLTQPQPIHAEQGRGQCQNRNLCSRGCPFGGYFSSNSSTLPWAEKTGNLTMLTDSIVHSIIYDEQKGKASGVRVIAKDDLSVSEYTANVIFVNASALNTNLILLNSVSARFPNGLGNDSGMLGKCIGFHNFRGKVMAEYVGFENYKPSGYSAGSAFMPRFQNVHAQQTDFLRGYNTMIFSKLIQDDYKDLWGKELKEMMLNPKLGRWLITAQMMGETIPKETNRVYLDKEKKDKYGLPQLRISVEYDDNDEKMLNHFYASFTEMFEKAGYTNIRQQDTQRNPGNANHEMGGARMGKDPATSILNQWNQIHGCKNVFVTDGACMTSTSSQNPSLTYMALTARAANYAFEALKKGEI